MNKYTIGTLGDGQYHVHEMIRGYNNLVFQGTIVEVHAWISLTEKGYDI